jgi:hypothetical protein
MIVDERLFFHDRHPFPAQDDLARRIVVSKTAGDCASFTQDHFHGGTRQFLRQRGVEYFSYSRLDEK